MSYLIKTSVTTDEPISLAQAQLHLRLDTEGSPASHPDDSLIEMMITTAREMVEKDTGLTLSVSQLQCKSKPVNDVVSLQTFPVTSIEEVTYEDDDEVIQTVSSADYYVDNFKRPSVLIFRRNVPVKDVTVSFTAGYTDSDSPNPFPMPKMLKNAMLLMIGNLYENRQAVGDYESYKKDMSYEYAVQKERISLGL